MTTRCRSSGAGRSCWRSIPGDNTAVCTKQLNAYTDDIGEFAAVDAQVLALSPQSIESHVGFAEKQDGLRLPAAGRHREDGRRGLRHPRSAQVLPTVRVRHRPRGQGRLRAPSGRRRHVQADGRAGRRSESAPAERAAQCWRSGDRICEAISATARAAIRRSGGNVGGGCCLGGSSASSSAVAAAIVRTAPSNACSVLSDVFWTPLTLRTY